jgi:predicted methyltransferase
MEKLLLVVVLGSMACAHTPPPPPSPLSPEAVVQASDRTPEDRAKDPGRKPEALLTFLQVQPGMKVGDVFAGDGYTTELLARSVGLSGRVYSENPSWILPKATGPWTARLSKPINQNVVRVEREMNDPFPSSAKPLDLVVDFANYHDAVWQHVDRTKMNTAIFNVLRPGGGYAICDSSAKPGSGLETTQTLHRIDEKIVRDEVQSVGFIFAQSSDFLRNPDDARDWNASPSAAGPRRGTSDRFCLMFKKP